MSNTVLKDRGRERVESSSVTLEHSDLSYYKVHGHQAKVLQVWLQEAWPQQSVLELQQTHTETPGL